MEDILKTLVSMPTVENNFAANEAAITFIDSYLRNRGLKPEIISLGGYQNLYVSTRGTKTPTVLLAAHVDVVPAPKDMFTVREDKGKLYGRGVFDMKFAIAAYLTAIDDLKDELALYDFGLMITPDEEIGSASGTQALVDKGYVPKACILPDGADDQNWDIEVFAKGAWFAEVTTSGKSAHGSRPWNGDNAVDKLIGLLTAIKALFPDAGKDASTLNIGRLSGGEGINRVPHSASATIDIRFPSAEIRDQLRTSVEQLCIKYDATIKDILYVPPTINDFNNHYLKAFAESVKTVTGHTSKPWTTPAGTDARYFTAQGIPVVVCVPSGGDHHSDQEWINKKGFLQFKDVVVDFIKRTAATS